MTSTTVGSPTDRFNRQEFLSLAWLASLGFFFINMGGTVYLFAMPRIREGEFGGVVTIGAASELPAVGSPPVNYPKVKFWLTHTEQGVKAIYKVCTHLGCLYNWSDQEGIFICPCHGSQFDRDGRYIQGPAPRDLDVFITRAVDPQSGEVLAETSISSGALPLPPDREVIIKVDTGVKITGKSHG